jgi:hypothetical protein
MHFNSFVKEKKLAKPIYCCVCTKEINNIMDSHDPEPLFQKPNRVCNVCNEVVVSIRLEKIRKREQVWLG